jgi:hypothetical protein
MTDFALTANDKASSLWLRLRAHLEERLSAARMVNDNASLSEQDTAALRGRIRLLKSLIALGDDRPVITTGNGEDAP